MKDIFEVTYHGLFDKIHMADVASEEKASEMCGKHNRTVPYHWLNIGVGIMTFVKKR